MTPITDTYFRFLVKQLNDNPVALRSGYVWYEMGFVCHRTSSEKMMLLCLDVPTVLRDSLQRLISSWREIPPPIDVHSCIIGEIVQLYDHSVWTLRNTVRDFEKVISRPLEGRRTMLT
jgi:hypothetical protein